MRFLVLLAATAIGSQTFGQTILGPEFDPSKDLAICRTSIEGKASYILYDTSVEGDLYDNYSFREMFFGETENISCPNFVNLQLLTPELLPEERETFCLDYDAEADTILGFSVGDRDKYLICEEPSVPLCERVNKSKDAALSLAGTFGGLAGGTTAATSAAGVSAVTHSSGALILTGNAGYIAGTLGGIGTTVISVLTAPATLAAAGVTVVVVGGAVYACSE